jgi:hypothetical protein
MKSGMKPTKYKKVYKSRFKHKKKYLLLNKEVEDENSQKSNKEDSDFRISDYENDYHISTPFHFMSQNYKFNRVQDDDYEVEKRIEQEKLTPEIGDSEILNFSKMNTNFLENSGVNSLHYEDETNLKFLEQYFNNQKTSEIEHSADQLSDSKSVSWSFYLGLVMAFKDLSDYKVLLYGQLSKFMLNLFIDKDSRINDQAELNKNLKIGGYEHLAELLLNELLIIPPYKCILNVQYGINPNNVPFQSYSKTNRNRRDFELSYFFRTDCFYCFVDAFFIFDEKKYAQKAE